MTDTYRINKLRTDLAQTEREIGELRLHLDTELRWREVLLKKLKELENE